MRIEAATCAPYGAAHCSNSEFSEVLSRKARSWKLSPENWGFGAPMDRFPAHIFIVLPSRRFLAAIIGNIRGITRFFARNSSFSFAVAPPHIHFYRISEFERHGSGDPTPCGGYPGPACWGSSFLMRNLITLKSTHCPSQTRISVVVFCDPNVGCITLCPCTS